MPNVTASMITVRPLLPLLPILHLLHKPPGTLMLTELLFNLKIIYLKLQLSSCPTFIKSCFIKSGVTGWRAHNILCSFILSDLHVILEPVAPTPSSDINSIGPSFRPVISSH
ncbi:hypothetical protein ILYODFUR_025856 [Ilyodon furcidens]|uniref:Uncharacterized protein n=1 Tax=Ilyodon furcidens TaxID=33524 RepID=A0ABV0TZH9_9TELE